MKLHSYYSVLFFYIETNASVVRIAAKCRVNTEQPLTPKFKKASIVAEKRQQVKLIFAFRLAVSDKLIGNNELKLSN